MSQIPRITLNPLLKGKHKSHPFQQTNELWFSCRFESLLQRDDTIQNNPANSVILWHWNFFHHTDGPLRFAYFMFEVKNTPWKSDTNIKNDGLENGSPLFLSTNRHTSLAENLTSRVEVGSSCLRRVWYNSCCAGFQPSTVVVLVGRELYFWWRICTTIFAKPLFPC